MSQNPYANPFPQQYAQPYPAGYGTGVPARTSAMAVLSLVCSLICCIPGFSVLGVLFGGLSLLAIGMSGGKVKGVGLAISGLIIGIVLTVVWVVIIIGVMQMAGLFNQMVDPALKAVEARDRDAVQATFVVTAHSALDENRVAEFADIMAQDYGTYERMPDGMGELISEFGTIFQDPQVGTATQAAQAKYGQNGVFPMPAKFDSGWHAIMIYMDSTGTNQGMPLLRDLGIIRSDGSIEWLVAGNSGGGTGPAPSPLPAGGDGPDAGDLDREPDPVPGTEQPATTTPGNRPRKP